MPGSERRWPRQAVLAIRCIVILVLALFVCLDMAFVIKGSSTYLIEGLMKETELTQDSKLCIIEIRSMHRGPSENENMGLTLGSFQDHG